MNKTVLFIAVFALASFVQAKSSTNTDLVFETADINADGRLDFIEFVAGHKLAKGAKYDEKKTINIFKKKDLNGDGFVTAAELAAKKKQPAKPILG